jgi:hypothetical protein
MDRSMTGTSQLTVSVSVKENGISMHHPKKRNWIKMEEEDDSFPHEIEEKCDKSFSKLSSLTRHNKYEHSGKYLFV